MTENIDNLKNAEKEKLDAAERTPLYDESEDAASEHGDKNQNWIIGIVLVLVGVFLLVGNVTDLDFDNWWAFFILIPALGSFGGAWRAYRDADGLNKEVMGPLAGGLILTFVAAAFLFNLDWSLIWPLFLIIGGLAALGSSWLDR